MLHLSGLCPTTDPDIREIELIKNTSKSIPARHLINAVTASAKRGYKQVHPSVVQEWQFFNITYVQIP
jgi:hypothetical protein